MTAFSVPHKKEKALQPKASIGQTCFLLLSVSCFSLLLCNAKDTITSLQSALLTCGRSVIPSLFPIAVLSELLSACGQGILFQPILSPLKRIFRLPAAGCWAVLLGWICGFPIGARCIRNAYLAGQLERSDAERALTFCSIPSPAFLINAVGFSLFESRALGIALYASVLSASFICGILITHLPGKERRTTVEATSRGAFSSPSPARLFTDAIRSACGSILLVCSYILFFSAFAGALRPILSASGLPKTTCAILFSLLEISVGMRECAALSSPSLSIVMAALAAGWSGLSVHCQLLSVCDETDLSLRPYLLSKVLQGLLSPLLLGAFLAICPSLLS